jgi:hypothetical protein
MKHFLIVLCLAGLLPVPGTAALRLPWFRTRPKPVLLTEEPRRVAWDGAPVYSAAGNAYNPAIVHPAVTKSRLSKGRGGSRTATRKHD